MSGQAIEVIPPVHVQQPNQEEATGWGLGSPVGNAITVSGTGAIVCGRQTASLGRIDLTAGRFQDYDQHGNGYLYPIAAPDGSLIADRTGQSQIFRQAKPGDPWEPIAGIPLSSNPAGSVRDPKAPVPTTVPALQQPLTNRFAPLGVRPDGSIIIADGTVVWSLKGDTLTRLLTVQSSVADNARLGAIGTVDTHGTLYVATESGTNDFSLGGITTIAPDGTVATLTPPGQIAGVVKALGALYLASMISDGQGGLYLRVGEPEQQDPVTEKTHQYVLHEIRGTWSVVAASYEAPGDIPNTSMSKTNPVDALHIPLFLPSSLAVLPGMLILDDGCQNYSIAVGVGK